MNDSVTEYGAGVGINVPNQILNTNGGRFVIVTTSGAKEVIIEAAEVVEINLNENDVFNLGAVKFRRFSEKGKDKKSLEWALPLSSQIKSYPVLYETVVIIKIDEISYYMSSINLDNFINNNTNKGITEQLISNDSSKAAAESYQETQSTGIPNDASSEDDESSNTSFINQKVSIPILVPGIGDCVIQGRFGNSIRLGCTEDTNLPNIKFSLVTNRNTVYKSHKENLDEDDGLWMLSDGTISFKRKSIPISTKNNPPSDYKGKQIILSSGRIIFNAKDNEILMFSNRGINLACNSNFSVDTDSSIFMSSKNKIEIRTNSTIDIKSSNNTIISASKIYLGGINSAQKMIKGETLVNLLNELIDIVLSHKHISSAPGSPSGPMIPPEVSKIILLKSKLNNALSRINYNV
jgi:hypothetical protein